MATKRGKKKKKGSKVDINIAVVVLILLSILLMVLIYTKSGSIGAELSPELGGYMGWVKYILPIGMLIVAIVMTRKDKYFMREKLIQYGMLLVCTAAMLSILQVHIGEDIKNNRNFSDIMADCFDAGTKDIGGGVMGGIAAAPLIAMFGTIGASIIFIGVSIILLIFIFDMKPAEMIANFLDGAEERKLERQAYEEETAENFDDIADGLEDLGF